MLPVSIFFSSLKYKKNVSKNDNISLIEMIYSVQTDHSIKRQTYGFFRSLLFLLPIVFATVKYLH